MDKLSKNIQYGTMVTDKENLKDNASVVEEYSNRIYCS